MTIKGSLQMSIPIVKAFMTWNFQSSVKTQNWPKICVFFGGGMGSKCKILFSGGSQKAHPCAKRRHLTYWWWKSVQGSWL